MAMKNRGFTLIELLVVISIIAVLLALLFPVARGVLDQAKRTQAKNDVTQIVTAVNAFYTEYGRYPTALSTDAEATYGDTRSNNEIFDELRGVNATALNPRKIAFLNLPIAKDDNKPRNGVSTDGRYFDPWGQAYRIVLDADYNEDIDDPYGNGVKLRQGVIAWSLGKDDSDKKDDVASWR